MNGKTVEEQGYTRGLVVLKNVKVNFIVLEFKENFQKMHNKKPDSIHNFIKNCERFSSFEITASRNGILPSHFHTKLNSDESFY